MYKNGVWEVCFGAIKPTSVCGLWTGVWEHYHKEGADDVKNGTPKAWWGRVWRVRDEVSPVDRAEPRRKRIWCISCFPGCLWLQRFCTFSSRLSPYRNVPDMTFRSPDFLLEFRPTQFPWRGWIGAEGHVPSGVTCHRGYATGMHHCATRAQQ